MNYFWKYWIIANTKKSVQINDIFEVIMSNKWDLFAINLTVTKLQDLILLFLNSISIWLKPDLYLRYRIEDLTTPHYWLCSVLIILTNQILTFMRLKVFRKLWFFAWINYIPKVTRKRINKTTFIIFKNTALRLKYAIWFVEIMTQYVNTKFIQSSLEYDQLWVVIKSSMR